MGIKVRVRGDEENYHAVGYFNHERRYVGEVFEIEDEKQLGKWMEPLETSAEIREAEADGKFIAEKRKGMRGRITV